MCPSLNALYFPHKCFFFAFWKRNRPFHPPVGKHFFKANSVFDSLLLLKIYTRRCISTSQTSEQNLRVLMKNLQWKLLHFKKKTSQISFKNVYVLIIYLLLMCRETSQKCHGNELLQFVTVWSACASWVVTWRGWWDQFTSSEIVALGGDKLFFKSHQREKYYNNPKNVVLLNLAGRDFGHVMQFNREKKK